MRKLSIFVSMIFIASSLTFVNANAAVPKVGASCSKLGSFTDTPGTRYVCVKSGSKKVLAIWYPSSSKNDSGSNSKSGLYLPTGKFKAPIPITLPVKQSTDPGAITFANMVEHISDIPQAAWKKVENISTTNKPVKIPNSIYVGPTTKIDIVGGTTRIQEILAKSARLWSGFSQADFYAVYVYNGADEAITEKKFAADYKARKYDLTREENLAGPLRALAGNCQNQLRPGQFSGPLGDCGGSDSGGYINSNDSFAHLGQTGTSTDIYMIGGGVLGHEYTHAVQAGQWINSPFCGNPDGGEKLCSRSSMSNVAFSPCWLMEGIPNSVGVMVTSSSAEDYSKFRDTHLPYGHGPTKKKNGIKQSFKIRHTQTAQGKVQVARETLGLANAYMDSFDIMAKTLFATEVNAKMFNEIILASYPKPEKDAKGAIKKWENKVDTINDIYTGEFNGMIAGNAWGAFNALTERLDWYRSARGGSNESILASASGFDPAINAEKNRLLKVVKNVMSLA